MESDTEDEGKNDEQKGNDDYDISSLGSHGVSFFLVLKNECVKPKRSIILVLDDYASQKCPTTPANPT